MYLFSSSTQKIRTNDQKRGKGGLQPKPSLSDAFMNRDKVVWCFLP